jgi:hypothetical protein
VLTPTRVQQLYNVTPFGALTINSAHDVTFSSTVNATSIYQPEDAQVDGTTTFSGKVNLTGNIPEIGDEATALYVRNNAINLNAGITAADASIVFDAAVVLTNNVTLTSSTSDTTGGNIKFLRTLDSDDTARNLTLAAGAGDILFSGAVGTGAGTGGLGLYSDAMAYWSFDDVSNLGGDYWNRYNISFFGSPYAAPWAIVGRAIFFDGGGQLNSFSTPENGTIAFWFKTFSASTTTMSPMGGYYNRCYVYIEDADPNGPIIEDPRLKAGLGDQDHSTIAGTTTLSDNAWYYAALTWDDSNVKLYLNGGVDYEGTRSGSAVTSNFGIGCLMDDSGFPGYNYLGAMDEAAVWARALSPSEIQALYNDGLGYIPGEGGTPLGDLTITSARNVTFSDRVKANSIIQQQDTVIDGTTQFNAAVNVTGAVGTASIDIINNKIEVVKQGSLTAAWDINLRAVHNLPDTENAEAYIYGPLSSAAGNILISAISVNEQDLPNNYNNFSSSCAYIDIEADLTAENGNITVSAANTVTETFDSDGGMFSYCNQNGVSNYAWVDADGEITATRGNINILATNTVTRNIFASYLHSYTDNSQNYAGVSVSGKLDPPLPDRKINITATNSVKVTVEVEDYIDNYCDYLDTYAEVDVACQDGISTGGDITITADNSLTRDVTADEISEFLDCSYNYAYLDIDTTPMNSGNGAITLKAINTNDTAVAGSSDAGIGYYGEGDDYNSSYNPVVEATGGAVAYSPYRRHGDYRVLDAAVTVDFIFNLAAHASKYYAITAGISFSATTAYDKGTIRKKLQTIDGVDITVQY